jgi:hypothetical protein
MQNLGQEKFFIYCTIIIFFIFLILHYILIYLLRRKNYNNDVHVAKWILTIFQNFISFPLSVYLLLNWNINFYSLITFGY